MSEKIDGIVLVPEPSSDYLNEQHWDGVKTAVPMLATLISRIGIYYLDSVFVLVVPSADTEAAISGFVPWSNLEN